MGEKGRKILLGKVFFKGNIVLKTGLHIGGSQESMQIGGLDLPVIRDTGNNLPYIPGSSLKGKLRSTLEKFGERLKEGKKEKLSFNRNIGTFRNKLFIHCCEDIKYAMHCDVCRIFGSSGDDRAVPKGEKAENLPSSLFVRDAMLDESLIAVSSQYTETKVETGIDRANMAANPRRVERVLPNNKFNFEMVYSVEALAPREKDHLVFPEENLKKDLNNILTCLELIQSEGIGGYTSRGYGKVEFSFSDFSGKSLDYFKGNTNKQYGKLDVEFSIKDARAQIEAIIGFLKEEAKSVIAG
ncbi:MAG: type III-A CRISPR-associated RAMP protein Csm3 [Thermodesulfovibrionales bacterium]